MRHETFFLLSSRGGGGGGGGGGSSSSSSSSRSVSFGGFHPSLSPFVLVDLELRPPFVRRLSGLFCGTATSKLFLPKLFFCGSIMLSWTPPTYSLL